MKKIEPKKAAAWAGRILMVLSFVLIMVKMVQYDIDFSVLTSPLVDTGLLLTAIVYGTSIFWAAFHYRWLLCVLSGVSVPRSVAIPIYCSSNLYKYIPGNIMHFIGRNRLAVEVAALGHAEVALATVTDSVFLSLAALLISTVCVFDYFVAYTAGISLSPLVILVLGAILFLLLMTSLLFRRRVLRWMHAFIRILKRFQTKSAFRLLLVTATRLLVLASTYFMTLVLLGQVITADMVPKIIGLFVLSWVIGFLMPGAPGGLGVREAIMMMFLGETLDWDMLVTSAIIHRVVCILGDLTAWGLSLLYLKGKGRNQVGQTEHASK